MNRRNFVKAVVPAGLLALLGLPTNAKASGEGLHFQQDPAVDWHYADRVPGGTPAVVQNGVGVVVDMSALDAGMKIVQGHLYIKELGTGRGTWKIETRPTGLVPFPPNTGWQVVHSHYGSGNEIGFQMAARCGNDGKFELRISREQAKEFEWAFAPVWWWS